MGYSMDPLKGVDWYEPELIMFRIIQLPLMRQYLGINLCNWSVCFQNNLNLHPNV